MIWPLAPIHLYPTDEREPMPNTEPDPPEPTPPLTPLEQYQALIREAERFEHDASPNATGGTTYWKNRNDALRDALVFHPDSEHRPKGMSLAAHRAIYTWGAEVLDALGLIAARELRVEAARLRVELERQRDQIESSLDQIAALDDQVKPQ